MTTIIRKAHLEDARQIVDLLCSIGWWESLEDEDPAEAARLIQSLLGQALADTSHSVYVAEADAGLITGYCAVHWLPYLFLTGPEGFISELFIRPEGRGQGLGGRLLAEVEVEARERGCSRLHLLNGRDRDSYDRGFYTKHGFKERKSMASFIRWLD